MSQLIDPLERSAGGPEEGDGGDPRADERPHRGLFVAEGERVEAGQRLAMVEAMKMEHALAAPFAGIVRDCSGVGDQVEMGEGILHIEATPEGRRGYRGGWSEFTSNGRPAGRRG